ncbi:hypothetical protein HYP58_gp89 [Vibrio phage 1.097.O._10N.286.49.B3]|uniref:Uncharacterized protein n=1 Tax=Vibrio phage 1.097.O._10N.286.49.B3 TaxID=1881383 RepID=A0A2I7R0T6_9CAUD|nr:hypothetical protein HYP58_gp89 [Vibrio phage 1.097.O._10N.286.49.B3]AUR87235.1 hypothetical protein NVP1097O_89 [Vibrio phage 1.097.O._10N.286.49.B3]
MKYALYKDESDPLTPYKVVCGDEACWYSVADFELDLHYVWNKDKHHTDEFKPTVLTFLGEFDTLDTLRMLHLLEE